MLKKIQRHLLIAWKTGFIAFDRSSRKGESLREILGYTDALTGIPNRKAFDEDRRIVSALQTFILIDVDNLKQINDTFGHLFGDQILCSCAHILDEAVEKAGKAYHLSGDEFALLVAHDQVKTVCQHIYNRLKEDVRFTVSMGIAPPITAAGLTDDLFRAAEAALYQCKHRGPDIYTEFLTDEIEDHASGTEDASVEDKAPVPSLT